MLRRLFTPFALRFQPTDSLQAALDLLERSYHNPKCTVSKVEIEQAMLVIGRELIRRKIVFWT